MQNWCEALPNPEDISLKIDPDRDIDYICDGDIEAVVGTEDQPYYGGCTTVLDVNWKCNKCGQVFAHPELPTEPNEFSKFVTKLLESAPQELLDELKDRYKKDNCSPE